MMDFHSIDSSIQLMKLPGYVWLGMHAIKPVNYT